ncbi:MAG: LacI family DNA-binding transcriptional regulator [Oscillospiraceae bacterium]
MAKQLTIKEIARLAGVGVSTVSRVVNGRPDVGSKTREAVMAVVEQQGYIPNDSARHLKQKTSDYVAVILRGTQNMFLMSIVEKLQSYIEAAGLHFLLHYVEEGGNEVAAAARIHAERKVRGIIFLGGIAAGKREMLAELQVTCVFVTQSAQGLALENVFSVSVDDRAAACAATEYLLQKGHRRIAVIGGVSDCENAIRRRYEGVGDGFSAGGLLFSDDDYYPSQFALSEAYSAMKRALCSGRTYTAVLAMSDTMAIGAARALRETGLRIPEEVSLVGYDGLELGDYFSPPLTTIVQPTDRLAETAIALLLQGLAGKPARHVTVDFALKEGASVRTL